MSQDSLKHIQGAAQADEEKKSTQSLKRLKSDVEHNKAELETHDQRIQDLEDEVAELSKRSPKG